MTIACGDHHSHTLPMPVPQLDRQTQDLIVERYRAGWTTHEIARAIHWTASTVVKYLPLNGVVPERGRITPGRHPHSCSPHELQRTIKLYRSGMSMAEVAAQLGLASVSTVHWRLHAAGEPVRAPGDGCRLQALRQPRPGPLRDAVLAHLRAAERPLRATEIANAFEAKPSYVGNTLRRLEQRGLVRVAGTTFIDGRARRLWAVSDPGDVVRVARALVEAPHRPRIVPAPSGQVPEDERLPIEPFRDWVRRLAETDHEGDGEDLARRLGLSQRRLYALLHQQDFISVGAADRMLLRADDGTFLWDLWPHLYEAAT
jgi:hypothetical protein